MPRLKVQPQPVVPTNCYLSDADLARRYRVHRATPWRWAVSGKFPRPVVLSPGVTRWIAAEVEQFDAERAASRGTAA